MNGRTVCFQCGNPVGEVPELNRLPSGETCRACIERAYDQVPAPLPAARETEAPTRETTQHELFPDGDEPA